MKHDVDVHVGNRIRHRRWLVGMTQQQLAEQVGIKFQQIQKYETGANRVSASRLWDIAMAMETPVSFYFEGIENAPDAAARIEGDDVADLPPAPQFQHDPGAHRATHDIDADKVVRDEIALYAADQSIECAAIFFGRCRSMARQIDGDNRSFHGEIIQDRPPGTPAAAHAMDE